MNILMIGCAFGHNMEPFIEYFNDIEGHKLTLLYSRRNDFIEKYQNVNFVKRRSKFKKIVQYYKLFRKNYDLLWYHGGYSYKDILFTFFLKPKSLKINLNIWGEKVPSEALKKNFQGFIYRFLFRKMDYIQCNWISTYNLVSKITKDNLILKPWGLHKKILSPLNSDITETTFKFIKKIPPGKFKIFFPKSIIKPVRHDLIIEASKLLYDKNIKNFIIYFWVGNGKDEALIKNYKKHISDYNLLENIKIIEHDFIPFNDMKYIWSKMDAGINIVDNDQLSTTVLEPMLYKKEVLLSKIEPYVYYDEKYKTNLNLVELNAKSIAEKLKNFINGYRTEEAILKKRRDVVRNNFNFDINIENLLNYFKENIK